MTSIKARTIRLHLGIIGYITFSFSTVCFGIHPWAECLTIDKLISVIALIFICQQLLMSTKDLPTQLRYVQLAALLFFMYTAFIHRP